MITERFAPSPTGLLHLGHAYSAAIGWISARKNAGQFLLRMEDLDTGRCRAEFYDAIRQDLAWLGLHWDGEVLCQSTRMDAYRTAIQTLEHLGVVYPCICTRKDLQAAISAPQEGAGVDGPIYPGTCRDTPPEATSPQALRLNIRKAIEILGGEKQVSQMTFTALSSSGVSQTIALTPSALIETTGDVVLMRKDGAPAYHLAVVVDDAFQNVTHVTRGLDLETATPLHRLLQALLDLPTPVYRHHDLIRDDQGKRLAKRDDARSLRTLRENGLAARDIFSQLGLTDQVAEYLP